MREACKNTPMEIRNYNYARFVIDPDEASHFASSGNDIVKRFVDEINGSAEGLKTSLGISISAKVSGKEKNVVLIEGVGKLFDANPDAFMDIARLKSRIVDQIEGTTSAPVIATAADMIVAAREKPPAKPVAKPAPKPSSEKPAAVQKPVPAKPSSSPVKPVKKASPAPAASPVAQPSKPAPVQSEGLAFMVELIKAEQLISKDDATKKYQARFHVDAPEAEKVIDAAIKATKGVEFTDGFIFFNKA
jgi:cell division septation protein DedD